MAQKLDHSDRMFAEDLLRSYNMTIKVVEKNRFRVESDFIVSHRHWFEVAENEQVIHYIATDHDEKWFPSLNDLDRFAAYLSFLRSVCEVTLRPDSSQLRKMTEFTEHKGNSLYEILALLYGEKLHESLQVAKKVYEVSSKSFSMGTDANKRLPSLGRLRMLLRGAP